jgi:3-methyladenine DNA glycosylase AlkD
MTTTRRSAASERARSLVDERLPQARGLGAALADLIDDPEDFVAVARAGLTALADDAYRAELARVAPGSAPAFGVRSPLLAALERQLHAPLAESSAASALWLAQRLADEDEREFILLSQRALRRTLANDPERAWQLIRRLAHAAGDWIAVDSLAELVAQGIILEPFRWAEIEQLVYSRDPWERRLVASTLATVPRHLPRHSRPYLAQNGAAALMLIESLLGDDRPEVQKALAWALRSWHEVQPHEVETLIRREAAHAAAGQDGHRAWVLRDALTAPAMPAPLVSEVRRQLAGVRRRPGEPSTSRSHEVARQFTGVGRLADRAVAEQGERQRLAGARR